MLIRRRTYRMETHEIAAAKQQENAKMMNAFGINPLTYKEGFAFDQEGQAELAEREKAEREERKLAMEQQRKVEDQRRAEFEVERRKQAAATAEKLRVQREEAAAESARVEKERAIGQPYFPFSMKAY